MFVDEAVNNIISFVIIVIYTHFYVKKSLSTLIMKGNAATLLFVCGKNTKPR